MIVVSNFHIFILALVELLYICRFCDGILSVYKCAHKISFHLLLYLHVKKFTEGSVDKNVDVYVQRGHERVNQTTTT